MMRSLIANTIQEQESSIIFGGLAPLIERVETAGI